ncbi:ribosomal protein S18 acetylase RimI-like enzyme [Krasilnikovia cinnamomea]|uniref:Ribosomal protein S18 acetylase RimI-like enzyme n=1 Tax=Krasilnikovia cinnamomea TaxID=349313 RepID=A0A4Q7ZE66_9ACTN|nr:GNAT family N-acetyltransferase [Krasilnikovia cinnamomea]RZU48977.1 ribosomal protein S18 acetylase RimI-like enzyme [Krasilnikovia cinnamomea]
MIPVRRATPTDADELMRLRVVMLSGMGAPVAGGPWLTSGADLLRRQLADPAERVAAFVVARPDAPQTLAACVVGAIDERLPGPHNPSPFKGYVYNVATDPGYRRRGYSRACMRALLTWYAERGVTRVDLRASPDGEPLYTALGFVRTPDPAMRLITRAR